MHANLGTMKLYVALDLKEEERRHLEESVSDLEIIYPNGDGEDSRLNLFNDSDICFGNVPPSWLEMTSKLRWIQLESVGFGEYQGIPTKREFEMTNLKGLFAVPVAESVLAGILALYRGTDKLAIAKRQRIWHGASMRADLSLLHGSRILILGGGSIGQKLIKILSAFDTKITLYDKYLEHADIDEIHELDEAIPNSDIIISCLPETNETIGLFGKERLASFSRESIFVNVGRGSVVDETALCQKLNDGELGGCVLDVTQNEPIGQHHPLWDCKNALITQHTGGGYDKEIIGKVDIFSENYRRFRSGQKLMNVVNMEQGY